MEKLQINNHTYKCDLCKRDFTMNNLFRCSVFFVCSKQCLYMILYQNNYIQKYKIDYNEEDEEDHKNKKQKII